MCALVRIIITTFCLSKMLGSIPIPVLIGNLQENEVNELLVLCNRFANLKMRGDTIYTMTDESQVPYFTTFYRGTAMFVDYDLPVVNKTLVEIWRDMTYRHLLTEISLRVINVVESVGAFLLVQISMLAQDIMFLYHTPHVLLRTVIHFLDFIDNKFYELTIPRTPVEDLREIMRPYTYALHLSPTEKAYFEITCTRFVDKYSHLTGFVDIGNVDLTHFDAMTNNTIEEYLNVKLVFLRTKVNNYFTPIINLDG